MNCIVDNSITYLLKQGKKAKAIRNYIQERYHISIDQESIRQRIKYLKEAPSSRVQA